MTNTESKNTVDVPILQHPLTYLYRVHTDHVHTPATRAIIRRYSAYKYGSPIEVTKFADEFITTITELLGTHYDAEQWVVVTPPYRHSGLPSSVVAIGEKVAKALGVPYVRGYTRGSDELAVGRYTGINSLEKRLADRRKTETRFDVEAGGLKGKSVILIDDVFVTGSTVINLQEVLTTEGAAHVFVFTITHLLSDSPTFEERVNIDILNDLSAFLQVLNHPALIVNRRTFKTIYLFPEDSFTTLINGLSISSLRKLLSAGDLYVRGRQDDSRLIFMEAVAALRAKDLHTLTPEQRMLTDKDIHTLNAVQKTVHGELDGRMILSGGYVAEALTGGMITRFHQDMDIRIFLPHGSEVDLAIKQLLPAFQAGGYTWGLAKRVGDKFTFIEEDATSDTPRKLEVNIEHLAENRPPSKSTIWVAHDADASQTFAVELTQSCLVDTTGTAVTVETRSMAETVARRILRLTGMYGRAWRIVKETDIRDLQRLLAGAHYDERTCMAYMVVYLTSVRSLTVEDATAQATAALAATRSLINDYTTRHM